LKTDTHGALELGVPLKKLKHILIEKRLPRIQTISIAGDTCPQYGPSTGPPMDVAGKLRPGYFSLFSHRQWKGFNF
jgi:hypothetical protein